MLPPSCFGREELNDPHHIIISMARSDIKHIVAFSIFVKTLLYVKGSYSEKQQIHIGETGRPRSHVFQFPSINKNKKLEKPKRYVNVMGTWKNTIDFVKCFVIWKRSPNSERAHFDEALIYSLCGTQHYCRNACRISERIKNQTKPISDGFKKSSPPPGTKWPPFWQKIISNTFSWMEIIEFRFKFYWNFFPWVQLAISQHWFR